MSDTNESVMYDTAAEIDYLREWAERQHVRVEFEGECGFGRECVGITNGTAWIDWGPPGTAPPDEVEDAYHKHDCLAVLGRGTRAIHQLAVWVRSLEANDVEVVEKINKASLHSPILAFMRGGRRPILVQRGQEWKSCESCGGDGVEKEYRNAECYECRGVGEVAG